MNSLESLMLELLEEHTEWPPRVAVPVYRMHEARACAKRALAPPEDAHVATWRFHEQWVEAHTLVVSVIFQEDGEDLPVENSIFLEF